MKRKLFLLSAVLVLLVGVLATIFGLHRPIVQASGGAGDWTMFQGDLSRTGTNLAETLITPSTAANLHYGWRFPTGGYVVASPVIVNGVMYIGSWDGYEYAIDVSTHQQLWRQYLGVTVQNKYCYAKSVGVTSTATVQNGVLYVGGGDGNMYALNTADGSVKWKTLLGSPPYYNFSSPAVYNNLVYTGLSAFCDPPYVQGRVVALDSNTGNIVASVSLVPDKQTGAPVWSSVAIDAATNTAFATTGNPGSGTPSSLPLSNSMVALDATTLAVKDHWQIPASDEVPDSDFGASPVLFDVNGVSYIGALNKNGVYYVLNRNNLSGGYLWRQVVSGNSQLVQGDNVSSDCYNNGVLYVGSAGGSTYGGTVHAFNAVTGQQLWGVTTPGPMVSSLTCTNGLVVDNQGSVVEVRDASNGNILFRHATMRRLEGTSVISNGVLYTPSTDGSIWAFTLKNAPTPTATSSATNIFENNLDSYSPGPLPTGQGANQWSLVNVKGTGFAINVSNTQASSTPNSLQFTMGSGIKGHAWAMVKYTASYTSHAAKFSLYIDPGLTYNTQAITLFTAENRATPLNGSASVWLAVNHSLQVTWYDSTGKKHVLATGNKLSSGQWYTIEIDQINNATDGSWTLWLNGTQLATQTGIDTGSAQVDAIIAGDTLSSVSAMSGVFYEDDVITATQHIG